MSFDFKAHKPNAYKWFAAALAVVILLNALLIQAFQSILLDWNTLVQQSVILIVPWIFLLFLPSVITGLVIYYALAKPYRFSLEEQGITIMRLNSKKNPGNIPLQFPWSEMKEFRFSDFEDNEYFTLVFADKKNNLVLHRDTGDFDSFFEELKKYMQ